MPPRFAYWTILVDNAPTAFRARLREELQPTLHQLQRKSPSAIMKWFAHGKLWDSPEAERAARRRPKPLAEKRGREWRPGGQHRDPRARFQKKARAFRKQAGGGRGVGGGKPPRGGRPFTPFHKRKRRDDEPDGD